MTQPAQIRYVPSLNGLRALVALLVFLVHLADFPTMIGVWGDEQNQVEVGLVTTHLGGFVGVFFFVLSGFIVAWIAPPGDRPTAFWRRRFFRIYPSHLVASAVGVAAMAAAGTLTVALSVPTVLLVQVYGYREWMPGINMPAWSVVCDVLFYLAFPFLLAAVRRIPPHLLWPCAATLMAVAMAVPFVVDHLTSVGTDAISWAPDISLEQFWLVFNLPPVRLVEFALGIVLARIVAENRWIGIGRLAACALLAVPCVLIFFVPTIYCMVAIWIVPAVAVIGAFTLSDVDGRRTWLTSRAMMWFGNLTLTFYLLHWPLLELARSLFVGEEPWPLWAGVPVSVLLLALVLAASWLLRKAVEEPVYRRFARSRRGTATTGMTTGTTATGTTTAATEHRLPTAVGD